ncbi:MAG: hypothetical protein ACO3GM_05595 [Candidatus Limnocylindrus sp.]
MKPVFLYDYPLHEQQIARVYGLNTERGVMVTTVVFDGGTMGKPVQVAISSDSVWIPNHMGTPQDGDNPPGICPIAPSSLRLVEARMGSVQLHEKARMIKATVEGTPAMLPIVGFHVVWPTYADGRPHPKAGQTYVTLPGMGTRIVDQTPEEVAALWDAAEPFGFTVDAGPMHPMLKSPELHDK